MSMRLRRATQLGHVSAVAQKEKESAVALSSYCTMMRGDSTGRTCGLDREKAEKTREIMQDDLKPELRGRPSREVALPGDM